MSTAPNSRNMDDPAVQEQIRRGPHEYKPTVGKHGQYVAVPYKHQEYPKMMAKFPRPEYAQFTKQNGVEVSSDIATQRFQAALTEWDRAMTASTVNNKTEELAWLKQNG
jgi:hypothetical protein